MPGRSGAWGLEHVWIPPGSSEKQWCDPVTGEVVGVTTQEEDRKMEGYPDGDTHQEVSGGRAEGQGKEGGRHRWEAKRQVEEAGPEGQGHRCLIRIY